MIATSRLRLRPLVDGDLEALLAYRRDAEVARYQSWSENFTEDQGRAFLRVVSSVPFGTPGKWVNLGVELTATRGLIGDVALGVEPDGASAQIGFTLARAHQGQGYGAEAVGALCDCAFKRQPLLFAVTDARNTSSIRLLERLAFRRVGFHARQTLFKGELCDELRFERSRRP